MYLLQILMQRVNLKGDRLKVNPEKRRELFSIKIDNLSENTTRLDVDKLVKPFGLIRKRYLAIKKGSVLCGGYAYVTFRYKRHAQEAINVLNGYEFKNLILKVDWSRPLEVSNVCNRIRPWMYPSSYQNFTKISLPIKPFLYVAGSNVICNLQRRY